MARTKKYIEEVVEAFLNCKSIKEIQTVTGLSRTAIAKYQKDAEFQDILAKRKIEAVKIAVQKMQMSLTEVAETVLSIATDEKVSPQIRLNACQIILSQCKSWTETADILERLAAIEKNLED